MNDILLAAVGLVASAVGFYVKQLYGKLEKLETKLQTHLVDDAQKYLPRSEMKDFAEQLTSNVQAMVDPINRKLESIESHLRNKEH